MLSGDFDYSEFVKFGKQLEKATYNFDQWLINFMTEQANKFLISVKRRTPVDTGNLVDSWKIDRIVKRGNDIVVYYSNEAVSPDGAHYASWVEEGHAKPYQSGAAEGSINWVNGAFMLKITLDELYKNLPRDLERSFEIYLAGLELI